MADNSVINNENLELGSSYTVYVNNNGAKSVENVSMIIPTSKHIAVKYHWFRQNVGKEFMI